MTIKQPVLLVSAALDESPQGIVLRGVVDPHSLHLLQVDDYQREVLPLASINRLVRAFEVGRVPDIELGVRGEDFEQNSRGVLLRSPVYIIDGLQRVSAALLKIESGEGILPHLGVTAHLNSTVKWERARFSILNKDRNKLSPNVLLRNWRYDYVVLEALYSLTTNDRAFVMNERVCWKQGMSRNELITAATLVKVVGRLHSHLGPARSVVVLELAKGLEKVMEVTGKNIFRDNVRTFFDVIDEAWGVRRVVFKQGAHYMRQTFLHALARLFSDHHDFWRENRLFVEADLRRKLATFPYSDPQIAQLSSSSGRAKDMLYMMLVDHVNSGKRTKRLKPRVNDYPVLEGSETDEETGNEE